MGSSRSAFGRVTVVVAALVVSIAGFGGAAISQSEPAAIYRDSNQPIDRRVEDLLSRMTLEEKVGQLFVMRVYGHSATDPEQADIDANLREIGVGTAAELIEKYHVGGIICFAWAHNTRDPEQIAALPGFSVKSGQRILDALRQSDAVAPAPAAVEPDTQ